MAAKQLFLSHAQEVTSLRRHPGDNWSTMNTQPVRKTQLLKGRAIPYTFIEQIDQAEIMKQFKIDDFRLENIIAIGAEKTMNEGQFDPSTLSAIDWMNQGAQTELTKLDAIEWYKKYNENNQQTQTKED